MAYSFPSFALVPFTKLLGLASRESPGLMRQISEPAVKLISEDMGRVGMIMDKFGKPTINISCERNEQNYRRFFTPLHIDSVKLFNIDQSIVNLEGFPVLQVAPHLLSSIHFTDGRHRVKACDRAFSSSIYDTYVLCCITTLLDSRQMIIDSYKKSEERPVVFASIQDLMQCLSPSFGIGFSLDSLRKEIEHLGFSKQYHLDIICKLQIHLFLSSKKLMDLHRDTELFTPESFFKAATKNFVQFIQESGRLQLSCYRYLLQGVLADLDVKEALQNTCILFCAHLSRIVTNSRDRTKTLALVPYHVMEILKDKNQKSLKLERKDVALVLAEALKRSARESDVVSDGTLYVEMLKQLCGENHSAIEVFLKSNNDDRSEIANHTPIHTSQRELPNKSDKHTSAAPDAVQSPVPRDFPPDAPEQVLGETESQRHSDAQSQQGRTADEPEASSETPNESGNKQNQGSETANRSASVHDSETVSDVNARLADECSITSKGSCLENIHPQWSSNASKRNHSASGDVELSEPRRSKRLKSHPDSSPAKSFKETSGKRDSYSQRRTRSLQNSRKLRSRKSRKKGATSNTMANKKPESLKAKCGYESLLRADQLLSRVTFLRLESCSDDSAEKKHKFSRLERLEDQGNDAVIFLDDAFFDTNFAQEAVKSITAITSNICCVASISGTEGRNPLVPHMELLAKGVLVYAQNEVAKRKLFIQVHGRSVSDWKGPSQFYDTYDGDVSEERISNSLCESLMCRLEEHNKKSTSFYDLMLNHHSGVLNCLLKFGIRGHYFKCLTEEQEDLEMTTRYLAVMRKHVLSNCNCGGHSLLGENNESSINEYDGPLHDGTSFEIQPFELSMGKRDSCPFGEVFPHTSLLLRKDRDMSAPEFADDDRRLCSREPIGNYNGLELHRGAFISAESVCKFQKETLLLDILYPKSFLVDSVSKMRFYETSLSPFEMRELFVSGITHRKLWLYFSNRSVASLFNERHDGGEVHFLPRYMDQEYLNLLYENGFTHVRELNMGLICCSLNPSLLERVPDNLICKNCGAMELLTNYGREYIHD